VQHWTWLSSLAAASLIAAGAMPEASARILLTITDLELRIPNIYSFSRGESVFSTLAGPTDSYKCGLMVFPAGTEAAPTFNPPKQVVSAFLKVVAPKSFEDWSCEKVSYTVSVKSRKNNRSDISLADTFTFTRNADDHGWHDLFRDKALSDYVSPEGELHVQGSVRKLPYVAAKAVPKVLFPDLDLTKEMKMITFKLADGPPLFFDQRLLIARSDYFKSMLIKEDWRETRTGEVDFTNNSDVTRESLQAILHYILTDSLDLQGSLEFYLTVRELADRFCLSGLVTIADAEMASLVNEGNVLQILGKTYDTNSEAEKACWELLESDFSILSRQATLDNLAAQPAARKLIVGRTKRPRRI